MHRFCNLNQYHMKLFYEKWWRKNPCRRVWSSQLISLLLKLKPSYNNISDLVKLVFHQYCKGKRRAALKSSIEWCVSNNISVSYVWMLLENMLSDNYLEPTVKQKSPREIIWQTTQESINNHLSFQYRCHYLQYCSYQAINTLKK